MGVVARTVGEGGMVKCERCEAPCRVEGDEGQARRRLKCTSCGHEQDAVVVPVSGAAKWTLVDPSGAVTAFASWAELVTALRHSGISPVHEPTHEKAEAEPQRSSVLPPRSVSAAALLDETPQPPGFAKRPKLKVVDRKGGAERASAERQPRVDKRGEPGAEWDDDVEMISLRDIQVVLPAGVATPPPPPRGALRTLPPAAGPDAPPPPTISVEEVGALGSPPVPKIVSESEIEQLPDEDVEPAPSTQRTPDVAERISAKAKVEVDETADKPKSEPKVERAATSTKTASAPEKAPASAKARAKASETTSARDRTRDDEAKAERGADTVRPKPAAARAAEPEQDTRTWLLPVAAIAMAAAGIAYAMHGTPDLSAGTGTPVPVATTAQHAQPVDKAPLPTAVQETPPQEPTTVTTPATTAATTPTTPAATAETKPAAATTPTPAADAPTAAKPAEATVDKPAPKPAARPADADARLTMPEQLEAAGKARRAGDLARAKDLYGRVLGQSPGNVEAYSGLAAIARSEGNLAGAKENYQKAVSAAPGFFPAILGLADVLWDLGERDAAAARYQQVVKSAPSVPDRARERAGGN